MSDQSAPDSPRIRFLGLNGSERSAGTTARALELARDHVE